MKFGSPSWDAEASIGITTTGAGLVLAYNVEGKDLRYSVPIERTSCTYGGARPWFRCPSASCGRRCGFLHQSGRYFVCRTCANFTYRTRQAHRNASEEAWAAGVSALGSDRHDPKRRDPVRQLLYRLARARNPRKVASLRRRLERLEVLRERDLAYLSRLTGKLVEFGRAVGK